MDKQSRANGLWLKLVVLLLTVVGFFCKQTLDRVARTEDKVNELQAQVAALSAKFDVTMGANQMAVKVRQASDK